MSGVFMQRTYFVFYCAHAKNVGNRGHSPSPPPPAPSVLYTERLLVRLCSEGSIPLALRAQIPVPPFPPDTTLLSPFTRPHPASDGGYTLLGLPAAAERGTFEGVKWSDALTCKSQVLALASRGVHTRVGGTYHDVDEADDVAGLERRSPHMVAEVRTRDRTGETFYLSSTRGRWLAGFTVRSACK